MARPDDATQMLRPGSKDRRVTITPVSAHPIGDADLAAVGSLLAEPARAKVLLALADGRSLAASALALEAGVAPSTASHHLAKLVEAGLISATARGRHRYFTLAGPRVGELIEAVARVAPRQPITSLRQGPRAHAVRYARRCYDHLAGRLGVAVTDALREQGVLAGRDAGADPDHATSRRRATGNSYTVTERGAITLAELGISAQAGEVVRCCLDWTEQRDHIAGPLGRAVMTRLVDLGWLTRDPTTRAVRLTDAGRANLPDRLGVQLP
jgi:DNA-binding transcriptional ArsR family regulator